MVPKNEVAGQNRCQKESQQAERGEGGAYCRASFSGSYSLKKMRMSSLVRSGRDCGSCFRSCQLQKGIASAEATDNHRTLRKALKI